MHTHAHLRFLPTNIDRPESLWTLPLFATSAFRLFHTLMNLSTLPTSVFCWYPEGEERKFQIVLHVAQQSGCYYFTGVGQTCWDVLQHLSDGL